ncbi:MAG: hypothetical protein ACI89J_003769 [Hyphomicrobiaceae bacterium]|jgi:uncharacterized protein YjiS (DUF1127 family)
MATHANFQSTQQLGTVDQAAVSAKLSTFAKVVVGFYRTFTASIRASRDIEQLSQLNDHQLRDIGIDRHDITRRVYDRHFEDHAKRD